MISSQSKPLGLWDRLLLTVEAPRPADGRSRSHRGRALLEGIEPPARPEDAELAVVLVLAEAPDRFEERSLRLPIGIGIAPGELPIGPDLESVAIGGQVRGRWSEGIARPVAGWRRVRGIGLPGRRGGPARDDAFGRGEVPGREQRQQARRRLAGRLF